MVCRFLVLSFFFHFWRNKDFSKSLKTTFLPYLFDRVALKGYVVRFASFFRGKNMSYSILPCFFSFLVGPVWAQPSLFEGAEGLVEFQRRLVVCKDLEPWLKDACMKSVYDGLVVDVPASQEVAPRKKSASQNGPRIYFDDKGQPLVDIEDLLTQDHAQKQMRPFENGDLGFEPTRSRFSELHLVSIYGTEMKRDADGMLSHGRAKVTVDRPGEEVALVLAAHEPVFWEVTATPGTTVVHVAVGGVGGPESGVRINDDLIELETVPGPNVHDTSLPEFAVYKDTVLGAMEAEYLSSVQGSPMPPVEGFVINASADTNSL